MAVSLRKCLNTRKKILRRTRILLLLRPNLLMFPIVADAPRAEKGSPEKCPATRCGKVRERTRNSPISPTTSSRCRSRWRLDQLEDVADVGTVGANVSSNFGVSFCMRSRAAPPARAPATAACPTSRPGKRAAAAVAANPGKSDRAIASEIGVSHPTVAAARKATGKDFPVERTGLDNKTRRMPQRQPAPQKNPTFFLPF